MGNYKCNNKYCNKPFHSGTITLMCPRCGSENIVKLDKTPKHPKSLKEAFSYTTQIAGTQWDPTAGRSPFNVITGMGYLEDVIKGAPRRDEKEAQAPKILPFPLDRIVDQLAKSYEELMKTKSTLSITIRTALLSKQEKALLRLDIKYVEHCLDTIKKISKDVERVHL